MGMIKGVTVKLYQQTQTGVDAFNAPVYEESIVDVDNVLISPVLADDVINSMTLYGKKAVYELSIPKGDSHVWEGCFVEFFGKKFRVFGAEKEYIESMVPLEWNKKVQVERYE